LSTFTIKLVDCVNLHGSPPGLSAAISGSVVGLLHNWFQRVLGEMQHSRGHWDLQIGWRSPAAAQVEGRDAGAPDVANLILYFVPGPTSGALNCMDGYTRPDRMKLGWTVIGNNLVGSEIYVDRHRNSDQRAQHVAQTAFHEAMHNMRRAGNDLHREDGLAHDDPDTGGAEIGTDPSPDNIRRLAAAIGHTPPQYATGLQCAITRGGNRDSLG
jgi:hypothetical protein